MMSRTSVIFVKISNAFKKGKPNEFGTICCYSNHFVIRGYLLTLSFLVLMSVE